MRATERQTELKIKRLQANRFGRAGVHAPRHLIRCLALAVFMAGFTPLLMHCGGSAGAQDSDSTLLLSLLQNENNFSSDSSAYTSNLTVNLERVRYCKNWLCTKQTTPSKFRYWEEEGVGRGDQRDTYIATISQPARSNVENLVFFAAGQQPPGNGVPNSLTGQDDKYKENCEGRTASCNRSIDGRSLTRQVMASGMFPMNRTFMAVAFDTQFNHLRSSDEKADMERAYLRWLLDKSYSSNVKRIYLAGSSRGGCLVMRLAQAIRENYSYRNIPLIVHSFDGVCKRTQNELGTYNSKIYNPLNSRYFSWRTNLSAEFPYKNRLAIFHIAGGDEVIVLSGAHSFAYAGGNVDYGWYRQQWVNLEHVTIGRDYSVAAQTISPALQHLQANFNSL